MVQGKHDSLIEPGINLYIATFYKILKFAESIGMKAIHLGRGSYEAKKKLGANRFNILNNWIKPANKEAEIHLKRFLSHKDFINYPPSNFLDDQ
jgi:hypothetical protein